MTIRTPETPPPVFLEQYRPKVAEKNEGGDCLETEKGEMGTVSQEGKQGGRRCSSVVPSAPEVSKRKGGGRNKNK